MSLGFCSRDVVGFEGGSGLISPPFGKMRGLVCWLSTRLSTDHGNTGVLPRLSTSYQRLHSLKTPINTGSRSDMHFQDIISTPSQIERGTGICVENTPVINGLSTLWSVGC